MSGHKEDTERTEVSQHCGSEDDKVAEDNKARSYMGLDSCTGCTVEHESTEDSDNCSSFCQHQAAFLALPADDDCSSCRLRELLSSRLTATEVGLRMRVRADARVAPWQCSLFVLLDFSISA